MKKATVVTVIIINLVILIFSTYFMLLKIEPFYSWFYIFAWWPYIFIIDFIVYLRNGKSIIINKIISFILLSYVSYILWLIFEVYNFFIKNWYYINIPTTRLEFWSGMIISYATVLPGIFVTCNLLESTNLLNTLSLPPIKINNILKKLIISIGGLFTVTPFIFPGYCFPLVWGGFTFLLLVPNYKKSSNALLRFAENGKWRKFFLLLISGFICGFYWELMNFGANTKWIYSVPFIGSLKIFEMPVIGFLGFPCFAVECYVMVLFFNEYIKSKKMVINVLIFIISLIFAVGAMVGIEKYNVSSYNPLIKDLVKFNFSETIIEKITEDNYKNLNIFLEKPELIDKYFEDISERKRLKEVIRLIKLKGIGTRKAVLLYNINIKSVKELSEHPPAELYKKLSDKYGENFMKKNKIRVIMIKDWIKALRH